MTATLLDTAQNVSVFGVILVRIFPTFPHIWTEYGEILRMSPYSVQMRENADQNNSEYGHFSRSEEQCFHHNEVAPDIKQI